MIPYSFNRLLACVLLFLLAASAYISSMPALAVTQSSLKVAGELKQGGMLIGTVEPDSTVRYQGKNIQTNAAGQFIIGLDRDAPATITLDVEQGEQNQAHVLEVAPRDYNIQRIEGVAKKYVAPDPVQVARSRKESRMVGLARKQQRLQDDFLQGFIWPASGPITGVFGSQRVYNGEPRRPHYGVDVAGPVGAPVVAPAGGLVTLAEPDLFFSGGTLIIDHGHGLSSTFLHLSKLLVNVGDTVEQGHLVAEIGATGRVTGPHLDWRMNWTGGKASVRIDPQLLVSGSPDKPAIVDQADKDKADQDSKSDSSL